MVINPGVLVGKPIIRGTRWRVAMHLNCLAQGQSFTEVIEAYPHLTPDDLWGCLLFAAKAIQDITYIPVVESAE